MEYIFSYEVVKSYNMAIIAKGLNSPSAQFVCIDLYQGVTKAQQNNSI